MDGTSIGPYLPPPPPIPIPSAAKVPCQGSDTIDLFLVISQTIYLFNFKKILIRHLNINRHRSNGKLAKNYPGKYKQNKNTTTS